MTSIPLVRVLTDAGYGSRREVSKLINAGLVEINGRIASSYTEPVDPQIDSVVVTGNRVAQGSTQRVYIMMNKPEGYLSATEDDRDRPTVLDILPANIRTAGLHPAGRLDEDSTGLLILTNDGQLTYQLTHPRFEHEKEYWVATTGRLTDADIARLEQGVEIEGQMTWPARVRILLGKTPYTYSITIHEGRKRQVRMMFAAINQQVALLKRVRLGGLLLGDLPEGKWRELGPAELKELLRKRPTDVRQYGVGHQAARSPYDRGDERARYPERDERRARSTSGRFPSRDTDSPAPYRASRPIQRSPISRYPRQASEGETPRREPLSASNRPSRDMGSGLQSRAPSASASHLPLRERLSERTTPRRMAERHVPYDERPDRRRSAPGAGPRTREPGRSRSPDRPPYSERSRPDGGEAYINRRSGRYAETPQQDFARGPDTRAARRTQPWPEGEAAYRRPSPRRGFVDYERGRPVRRPEYGRSSEGIDEPPPVRRKTGDEGRGRSLDRPARSSPRHGGSSAAGEMRTPRRPEGPANQPTQPSRGARDASQPQRRRGPVDRAKRPGTSPSRERRHPGEPR